MGRSSNARERLLEAAGELMLHRGYGHIGIAEICDRAEVRKGSFYHFFESKQSLTLEIVDAHWRDQRATWTATLSGHGSPLSRLARLFQETEAIQHRSQCHDGSVRGCLLGNLALELSAQAPTVQGRLREIFDEQIELVRAALADAAASGEIPHEHTGPGTARAMIAQMEGMVLFSKLMNDPSLLAGLWPQVRLLLQPTATAPSVSPAP